MLAGVSLTPVEGHPTPDIATRQEPNTADCSLPLVARMEVEGADGGLVYEQLINFVREF